MPKKRMVDWGAAVVVLAVLGGLLGRMLLRERPLSVTMSRQELEDRIRGGWAGQMIGVGFGAPTEFQARGEIFEGELGWTPGQVENALDQDDLYVEMTFAKVMDEEGLDASSKKHGEAFKKSRYSLWHANAAARRALNQGVKVSRSGHPRYNFHANDIDFQIESDFIGLMCPGLPQASNIYCGRIGRIMNYGEGVYGGMFVCGMYTAAFFETDVRKVVETGLACISEKSSYARLIRDVLDWSALYPGDWRRVWQMVEDKWDKDDACPDGALASFNIDAKINGAYIVIGLLHGEADFRKTMEISVRCGQDSDCNPSNAAGILGTMLGFSRIPDEFRSGIGPIADRKFAYTDYSFNDICRSTMERALELIKKRRGRVRDTEVDVAREKPMPRKFKEWSPGIPDKRIDSSSSAWKWGGRWTDENGLKVSRIAGSEARLDFEGVAIAVLGRLNQEGGRAEVYLDGKKAGQADAYIVDRTHDNVLWHAHELKPGRHRLRIVSTGEADPRSRGIQLAIRAAVVYR